MDTIADGLIIGTAREAADRDLLDEHGIDTIVSLSQRAPDHSGIEVHHIPLSNGPQASQEDFETAVDAVRTSMAEGATVLVHCRQGISRSVAVVATVLAIETDQRLRDAIATVERERPGADPARALIDMAVSYRQTHG